MNTLLLDALKCRNLSSRPPVWLMRQAGRYMPQYRAYRERYSFLEMVHQPEIAAEITMLPIELLNVDAAILFSDILVIPEALGVGLRFDEGIGPIIERPLHKCADVDALQMPDVEGAFGYTEKAIRQLCGRLKVPLLGFCGAPFTLASYMIEGKSSRDLRKTKRWMLQEPESFHRLLDMLADLAISYLNLQIRAGASAVQIFDSWAHFLADDQFREFSLSYMKKIVAGIENKAVPTILFCRGSSLFAPQLASAGASAISIDWNGDIAAIRKQIPKSIALQGNLDPDILYAPQKVLDREVNRLLDKMKGDPGYIFNLGHGVLPTTPLENVQRLVETIHG